MTILDTFYILFKTNADDIKKGADEVEKKTKEVEKSLKSSNEQAESLGKSFVKLAEAGAAIVAGYIGFNDIRKGILNVAEFNAGLGRTAHLAGQSAQSLKQMGQAAAQTGGTASGAIQNMLTVQQHLAEVGKSATPEEIMEGWRAALAGKDAKTQLAMFPRLNINDTGLQTMATMSAGEYRKNWRDAGLNTAVSDKEIKTAQDFLTELSKTTAAFQKLEQIVGTPLLKAFSNLLNYLTSWLTAHQGRSQSVVESVAHTLTHPVDTAKTDADFIRDWVKGGGISRTAKGIVAYDVGIMERSPGVVMGAVSSLYDWWTAKPAQPSLSMGKRASSANVPPPLDAAPPATWSPGQSGAYATEAQRAFAAQVNHINRGSSTNVHIDSVTVNTQATDGKGTADAFKQMLANVAGNVNDGVSK